MRTGTTPLEKLRTICLALPEVSERISHGEPAWFIKDKKLFVTYADHHHNDRVAFWCAAPLGAQQALTESEPERYFRPPYVGHKGWLGVYLDISVSWDEINEIVKDAWMATAHEDLQSRVQEQ